MSLIFFRLLNERMCQARDKGKSREERERLLKDMLKHPVMSAVASSSGPLATVPNYSLSSTGAVAASSASGIGSESAAGHSGTIANATATHVNAPVGKLIFLLCLN